MEDATRQEKRKNTNPTGKGGFADHPEHRNALGEPKNSLKNYTARKLAALSDEDKEKFLKKIAPDFMWRMGEGNPDTRHEIDTPSTVFDPELIDKAKKLFGSGHKNSGTTSSESN